MYYNECSYPDQIFGFLYKLCILFLLNFRSFFSMKRKKSSWHWPRGGGGREEVSHSSQAAAAKATFCILNDDVKRLYFFLLFMCITACPVHTGRSISEGSGSQRQHPLNITAVTGITVELKCKVKLHECGNFNG